MPKRQDYEADDGFMDYAPQSKKRRSAGNELKRTEGKATVSTATHMDEQGSEYWEISRTRRVQISNFKGTVTVGIREFYEKDGEMLPGKKGITLPIDQFTLFLDILPQVERALRSKGVTIPRPQYDGAADGADEDEKDEDDEEDGEDKDGDEEEVEKPRNSSRLDTFKMKKANHEPTDDEDEE